MNKRFRFLQHVHNNNVPYTNSYHYTLQRFTLSTMNLCFRDRIKQRQICSIIRNYEDQDDCIS